MAQASSAGFSLAQVLSLALGSGVIAAIISQALSAWFARGTYRREAAYTALRAAIALEAYAEQAAHTLNDWHGVSVMDVYDEREREHESDRAGFPKFDGFDDRLDWRHVDGKLSARALTFANEIRMAGDWISEVFDVDDDSGLEEMQMQAGLRGTRAIELAADLRRAYGLPEWSSTHLTWDYMATVRELYAELIARKAKRDAQAELPDSLDV